MAGTQAGGRKARETNRQRHGEDFYNNIGAKGGSKPTNKPKGFAAMDRAKFLDASRRGGVTSRKGAA